MSSPAAASAAEPRLELWHLPGDALALVLAHLTLHERLSLRRVCSGLRASLEEDAVWSLPFSSRWPLLKCVNGEWREAYERRAREVSRCAFNDPELHTVSAGAAAVEAMQLVNGGRTLLAACGPAVVVLGDAKRGLTRSELRGHTARVLALQACDAAVLSSSADRTLRLWPLSASPRETPRILRSHDAGFSALAPLLSLPCGFLASAGCTDGAVVIARSRLSSSPRGDSTTTLRGHGRAVRSLAWADCGRLLSVGGDGKVKAWDVERSLCISTAPLRTSLGGNLRTVIADGASTAYVLGERRLARLDWREPATAALSGATPELPPSSAPLCAVALRDGHLATGHADGMVRIWDARSLPSAPAFGLRTHPPLFSYGGHAGAVTSLVANAHCILSAVAAPEVRQCGRPDAQEAATLRLWSQGGAAEHPRTLRMCDPAACACSAECGCDCPVRAVALGSGSVAAASGGQIMWRRYEKARQPLEDSDERGSGAARFWASTAYS